MNIAATRASGSEKYLRYQEWLKAADANVVLVDLHGMDPEQATAALNDCAGLLLTGGPDVEPHHYGLPEKAALCQPPDVARDAMELAVIGAAVELRMPMLGICRGAQMLNVAFGGTLVADIPEEIGAAVEHRQVDGIDQQHALYVEGGSLIKRLCNVLDGSVNTAHHQGVAKLANAFAPSAYAPDDVIEAFEWGDAAMGGKPFLLGVQWHPERMEYANPLSLPIAHAFVHESAAYAALLQK